MSDEQHKAIYRQIRRNGEHYPYKIHKFWSPDANAAGKVDECIGSLATEAEAQAFCGADQSSVKSPRDAAYFYGYRRS